MPERYAELLGCSRLRQSRFVSHNSHCRGKITVILPCYQHLVLTGRGPLFSLVTWRYRGETNPRNIIWRKLGKDFRRRERAEAFPRYTLLDCSLSRVGVFLHWKLRYLFYL